MSDDVRQNFRRAVDEFGRRVHDMKDEQWQSPTPCAEWDVRALVNHMLSELLWMPPLYEGMTIAEVGAQFEGDVLGDHPVAAWDEGARKAVDAVDADSAMERAVHLSFGDTPGDEYARQVFADLLIHGWDLARGAGQDERLDPELVSACASWFVDMESVYRDGGAIAARPETPADADEQTKLLAAFGRKA